MWRRGYFCKTIHLQIFNLHTEKNKKQQRKYEAKITEKKYIYICIFFHLKKIKVILIIQLFDPVVDTDVLVIASRV